MFETVLEILACFGWFFIGRSVGKRDPLRPDTVELKFPEQVQVQNLTIVDNLDKEGEEKWMRDN